MKKFFSLFNLYRHWKKWLGLLLLTVGLFLVVYLDFQARIGWFFSQKLTPWLNTHPYLGPVLYIFVYLVGVVLFIPGSIITLPGGAVFGPVMGTIYVSLGSTLGAIASFFLSRYYVREWIESRAGETIDRIQKGIKKEGWRYIAITRLVPIFPYNLQNYAYGLTRIDFWTYLIVTWICMLPGTIAYVYVGYAARVGLEGKKSVKEIILYVSIGIGLVILVSLLPKFISWIRDEKLEPVASEVDDAERGTENLND